MNLIKSLTKILPTACLLCKKMGHHSLANLCADCQRDLPHLRTACQQCALPMAFDSQTCASCSRYPSYCQRSLCALIYAPPVDRLILRLKQGSDLCSALTLASVFVRKLKQVDTPLPDAIVPVPLYWRRQLSRGFNQSQTLALFVGERMAVPVKRRWLTRARNTRPQQGLKRSQRRTNLKRCFVANPAVSGRHIALFDDVITTGATMEAAAIALKDAGAKTIVVWGIARTAAPSN